MTHLGKLRPARELISQHQSPVLDSRAEPASAAVSTLLPQGAGAPRGTPHLLGQQMLHQLPRQRPGIETGRNCGMGQAATSNR